MLDFQIQGKKPSVFWGVLEMYRRRVTRGNRANVVVAVYIAVLCFLPGQQALAGEESIGGRNISTLVDAKFVEVGDVEGHVLGSFEGKGVTLHSDGEASTFIQTVVFDYVNDVGSHKGYSVRTYPDGAMITSTFRGTTKRTEKGRRIRGTFEITSGTGRLAGATGTGSYDGYSTKVGMSIIDWEGTMNVPAN